MTYIDTLISNCHKAKAAKPTKECVLTDNAELQGVGKHRSNDPALTYALHLSHTL
uniref:hypothetical protein n=1 Tax=Roseivirga sp. TaxID=1964215 RepID=UPI0040474A29